MPSFSEQLLAVIAGNAGELRGISDHAAGAKPRGPQTWSNKQELGHLLDSVTNNRVRFIRAALDGHYEGPTYDGPGWVELGGYAEMRWVDLVDIWKALNLMLAGTLARIPPERLTAPCRIAGAELVTLEFLVEDYIMHMRHHLDHILAREHQTPYAGSARGL